MQSFKSFTQDYESISIEILGNDNQWRRTDGGISNKPQAIARAMEIVKKRHPNNRVRAVGQTSGRFYDMLP